MQQSLIEQIRQKIDIVQVISKKLNLIKKGNNYLALCPFHQDSNPSLTISPSKQIFKCFVCSKGGDAINFVSLFDKISYHQALKKLGIKVNIIVQDQKPQTIYDQQQKHFLNLLKDANEFFMYNLQTTVGKQALKYTKRRDLNQELIEKFQIGYAHDKDLIKFLNQKGYVNDDLIQISLMNSQENVSFKNRLTFAINDFDANVIGFVARTLDQNQSAKYINSAQSLVFEKSQSFYNWHRAFKTIEMQGQVFLVEGIFDVIAFYKIGIENVVGLMGTNLNYHQIQLLQKYNVTLMLDQDQAGLEATLKIIIFLVKNKINFDIVDCDFEKDPDHIYNLDQGKSLKKAIHNRLNWLDFIWKKIKPSQELNLAGELEKLLNEFKPYLQIANALEKEFYLNKLSKIFNISQNSLNQILKLKINHYYPIPNLTKKPQPTPFKSTNYEYILIRSMFKNKEYIDLFAKNNLIFQDETLNQIGRLLIKKTLKTTPSNKIKQKCQEILKESQKIAKTSVEFCDYIDRIKRINCEKTQQEITTSIQKINDDDDVTISLLEEQIRLKKGLK